MILFFLLFEPATPNAPYLKFPFVSTLVRVSAPYIIIHNSIMPSITHSYLPRIKSTASLACLWKKISHLGIGGKGKTVPCFSHAYAHRGIPISLLYFILFILLFERFYGTLGKHHHSILAPAQICLRMFFFDKWK